MKILVTGACGFIGLHVCSYFSKKQYEVIGWDIIRSWNKQYQINQIDLLDVQNVLIELKKEKPDIIIHCAGENNVGKSKDFPFFDFAENVSATHNLVFAMQKAELWESRLLFLSSASVYGNPAVLPIKEDTPLCHLSPYALHKGMCEEICKFAAERCGQDIKILRVFSAYGEGLRKKIFWDMFLKADRSNRLEMFGTGLESRDYIYISDLVNAVELIAFKAEKKELVYNVANGREYTIQDVTELFADAYGINKQNIVFNGKNMDELPIHWKADISKLKMLGYDRKVSMEEGVKRYINWLRK